MMDFGFGFGWLWMVLFLVLIIAAVVIIVKGASEPRIPASFPGPRHQTPLQILEERYARGEVEREEFLQKKQDLEQGSGE
jgi:putative membrane protein